MHSHLNVIKFTSLSPVGEAESHLKEVVLEIAFPLRALFKPMKYLLSLLGTYIKAGKFLLQAYYRFTLGLPPLLVSHKAWISYVGQSSHLGLLSREVLREGLGGTFMPPVSLVLCPPLQWSHSCWGIDLSGKLYEGHRTPCTPCRGPQSEGHFSWLSIRSASWRRFWKEVF